MPPTCIVGALEWPLEQNLARIPSSRIPAACPPDKQFVPKWYRLELITWTHTTLATGHSGACRTYQLLAEKYWWPNMPREVQCTVSSCSSCAQSKGPCALLRGKFVPLPIPEPPWSHLALAFITDLPKLQGNSTILVVVDWFLKSLRLIPLPAIPSAFTMAELLFQHVFCYFGIPEEILTDRGPQFTSRVWASFMRKMGVGINLTSRYHPQAKGQAERANQEVIWFLQTYCSANPGDRSQYLPWAEYAQNSLRYSATQLTPFQCVLGYQPPLFPWNASQTDSPAVDKWFRRSEQVWERAHQQLVQASHIAKRKADRRSP